MKRECLLAGGPPVRLRDDLAPAIEEVLRVGGSGHFAAAASLLAALCDRPGARAGERAMCGALLALAAAALGDRAAARRFARATIRQTARPPASTPAATLRDMRRARALAANASALVGDVVRARRAAQVRFLAGDLESAWLLGAGLGAPWQEAPGPLQRLAKFVAAAHRRFGQECRRGEFTPTEAVVLRSVKAGAPVDQTASQLERSERTVRAHLRSAYVKQGIGCSRERGPSGG